MGLVSFEKENKTSMLETLATIVTPQKKVTAIFSGSDTICVYIQHQWNFKTVSEIQLSQCIQKSSYTF
jgi:hypothetical protein